MKRMVAAAASDSMSKSLTRLLKMVRRVCIRREIHPTSGLLFICWVPIRVDVSSIFPGDRVLVEIFPVLLQIVRECLRHQLDEVPPPLARPPPPIHRVPDEVEEEEDGVLCCN